MQVAEGTLWRPSLSRSFDFIPGGKETVDRKTFQKWDIPLVWRKVNHDSRSGFEPAFSKML